MISNWDFSLVLAISELLVDPQQPSSLLDIKLHAFQKAKDVMLQYEKRGIRRDLLDVILDKKLKLIIKDSITIDCTSGTLDPMTKAFLQISGVFAELERNIISERVKSGMRNAKAKGVVCGRGKTSIEDIPAIFKKYYAQYKAGEINKSELAKLSEVTRPTAYKYIEILDGEADE